VTFLNFNIPVLYPAPETSGCGTQWRREVRKFRGEKITSCSYSKSALFSHLLTRLLTSYTLYLPKYY